VFILLKLKNVGINVLNTVLIKNIQNVKEFLLEKEKNSKNVQLKILVKYVINNVNISQQFVKMFVKIKVVVIVNVIVVVLNVLKNLINVLNGVLQKNIKNVY